MQLEHNFNKAASYIRSAAAQGAELAVLPEYHLTNWLPQDSKFIELAEQWETYLQKYRDLAKECGICIVPGTIVESHKGAEKEEDKLLNVAYFIDHTGEIVGKYVKKNLWGPEREHLTGSGRDGMLHHMIYVALRRLLTVSLQCMRSSTLPWAESACLSAGTWLSRKLFVS
jgi:predicted amidohydrolase